MEFEFDEPKNRTNKARHGIDFIEAQALWEDVDVLKVPAKTEDEPRAIVIGKIGDTHWPAIITWRKDRIRIISVRRSRQEEQELYES